MDTSYKDLTEHERAILKLIAEGKPQKVISKELGIPLNTLQKILSNENSHRSLYRKIGVNNFVSAAMWYRDHCEVKTQSVARIENSGSVVLQNIDLVTPPPYSEPIPKKKSWPIFTWNSLLLIYIILTVFVYIPNSIDQISNDFSAIISNFDAFIPLVVGIYSLYFLRLSLSKFTSQQYRNLKLLFAGMLCWACGEFVWLFCNLILRIDLPYPSWPDYFGYIQHGLIQIIVSIVIIYTQLKNMPFRWVKHIALLIIMIGFNMGVVYLMRQNGYVIKNDDVKIYFDLFYPTSHAFGVVALLIMFSSSTQPHEKYTYYWLCIGSFVFFVADFIFVHVTSLPEKNILAYTNGNWVEAIFSAAYIVKAHAMMIRFQLTNPEASTMLS